MKKHIVTHLILVILLASNSSLLVCTPNHDEKSHPGSSFSVEVNIPSLNVYKIQAMLVSSLGFVASSAALVLIATGAIAHSRPQSGDASARLHASTLFGYGVPLLAAGILTIFHPQVRDFLNS
ncbi:MAG: hypothetical protein ACHQVS_03205 [Candidatus Babeliales bacterium]